MRDARALDKASGEEVVDEVEGEEGIEVIEGLEEYRW